MKKTAHAGILAILVSACLFAASDSVASFSDDWIDQRVFLRHNLVFAGQAPRVYADDIVFIEEQKSCDKTIWKDVIGRGAPVKILGQEDQGDFLRLTIASGLHGDLDILYDKVDVLLARSENGDFWPAFNNAFSFAEVEADMVETCEAKTEAELIAALGYPIYRCRKESITIFYYNLGFLGCRVNSFHDIWFEVRDGKVIGNYGNI
jgi:hypothetical protein